MKISEYHVWLDSSNTGDKCDLSILIKIYAITESKHGKAMVNGNRLPIYRSNTFCLIRDDEYISKDAAHIKG